MQNSHITTEKRIRKALRKNRRDQKIGRIVSFISVVVIGLGITIMFNQDIFFNSQQLKIAGKFADNDNINANKIMIGPEIAFKDDDGNINRIKAKKAISQQNLEDFIFYEVVATGEIGKMTAGYLEIKEKGDLLIFGNNPQLVVNDF